MGTVDNVALVLVVRRGLRSKLTSKELGGIRRRTAESAGHVGHVGNDGLDTIALAFNFRGQDGHAVAYRSAS